jgi:hypothetical protein
MDDLFLRMMVFRHFAAGIESRGHLGIHRFPLDAAWRLIPGQISIQGLSFFIEAVMEPEQLQVFLRNANPINRRSPTVSWRNVRRDSHPFPEAVRVKALTPESSSKFSQPCARALAVNQSSSSPLYPAERSVARVTKSSAHHRPEKSDSDPVASHGTDLAVRFRNARK